MNIIPVVDLMDGVAVHARRGRREDYRPLCTPLSPDAGPVAVVEAFLTLHDFREFYLADLDALTGRGDQTALVETLCRRFPEKIFWVDAGTAVLSGRKGVPENLVPVVGSESLTPEKLSLSRPLPRSWILSLDTLADRRLGPDALFETDDYWPERVIIMTLGKVGSAEGPDFDRLTEYRRKWPETRFVAAGGVRNDEDLVRLEGLGIHAALVASALHSGDIGADSLRRRSG